MVELYVEMAIDATEWVQQKNIIFDWSIDLKIKHQNLVWNFINFMLQLENRMIIKDKIELSLSEWSANWTC